MTISAQYYNSERLNHPIRQLLEFTQSHWDDAGERDVVRRNFRRTLDCGTARLGANVYGSEDEEKIVYHTCKSRCCPRCGSWRTKLWQREQWAALPDISFKGIVLTMPDHFWPIFAAHRNLERDLPALGAGVLKQYAWTRWRVSLCIVVVLHTFGGRLNYYPHLHLMVSAGGFNKAQSRWIKAIHFDENKIMSLWRKAVVLYLQQALRKNLLKECSLPANFRQILLRQLDRPWHVHFSLEKMEKDHFVGYAGRYIRRLPISRGHILSISEVEVVYQIKDRRNRRIREIRSTPAALVALLAQHVPEHYTHSMRYFGLLSPRSKHAVSPALFLALGQQPRPRPERQSWRASMIRTFKIDPLLDTQGREMRWKRRIPPIPA